MCSIPYFAFYNYFEMDDLRAAILQEHSKVQTHLIVQWIGNDAVRLDKLMFLFVNDEYRVVQRAAWPLSEVAKLYPDMFDPYIPVLIEKLEDVDAHPAVKRNVFRIFEAVSLPETFHGIILNYCFEALENYQEALAVRAFAITIISKLILLYPELIPGFKIMLEDTLDNHPPPSFVSRAKRALKSLDKKK